MTKIYTRTGDKGKTSLYKGKRVYKDNLRVNAYGSVDELNSLLGLVLAKLKDDRVKEFVEKIQEDLLLTGSYLAGADVSLKSFKKRVSQMEKVIDKLDEELPKLKNFILPQGIEVSCLLYFTRAVARRAEREIVGLSLSAEVDKRVLVYFNRLSDLLFEWARYLNFKSGFSESVWKGRKYRKRM